MRCLVLLLPLALSFVAPPADDVRDQFHDAARRGDVKAVKELLGRVGDVNARNRFGATALWFAAYKDRTEVVKLLLAHKANPDLADNVWAATPLELAASFDNTGSVKLLLAARAKGADAILIRAAVAGKLDLVAAVLEHHRPAAEVLGAALLLAAPTATSVRERLQKAGAKPLPAATADELKRWQPLVGEYENPNGLRLQVQLRDRVLVGTGGLLGRGVLRPVEGLVFRVVGNETARIRFELADGKVTRVTAPNGATEIMFLPAVKTAPVQPGPYQDEPAVVRTARNWPSFRGEGAAGVADGQHPPGAWDVEKPHARMWKTPIAGLGHSCPVVWGDRVFVTTAVSADPKSEFKPGLYGALTAAKDRSKHVWKVCCLDRKTGKVLWERTACEGVPKVRRHLKASHANATPATDGKRLIVSFASEGLYGYDLDGKLLWKQDLGTLDAGAFNDPDAQWEAGSSPVLWNDLVIVQCDRQKDSYLAAFHADTGKPAWRTPRDEPPSWGTPTVIEGKSGPELVANGTHAVRGYDPRTGKERWQLRRNSQITVPTPFIGEGLIFVTAGYRPVQPIYAIWPGARGDITLKDGQESSEHIAWSKFRGGTYMPTPICYRGHLYTVSNAGQLTCYEARSGKLLYRQRLGGRTGYTASPVAADGRLYFTGEDGRVDVVAAGPVFRLLAVNKLDDTCLATPAIADGTIFFRTQKYLMGIGRKE
jgi:outer membrane protein assembly factor BamB